ncbi:uncharacterized protein [Eschrichtius robustus]|uniref:uncharacterized protein n=1 Tax=Eschrichtius robustus TaxID=9764 RepID=UPI0035C045D3
MAPEVPAGRAQQPRAHAPRPGTQSPPQPTASPPPITRPWPPSAGDSPCVHTPGRTLRSPLPSSSRAPGAYPPSAWLWSYRSQLGGVLEASGNGPGQRRVPPRPASCDRPSTSADALTSAQPLPSPPCAFSFRFIHSEMLLS